MLSYSSFTQEKFDPARITSAFCPHPPAKLLAALLLLCAMQAVFATDRNEDSKLDKNT